jgi:hypothetical protein
MFPYPSGSGISRYTFSIDGKTVKQLNNNKNKKLSNKSKISLLDLLEIYIPSIKNKIMLLS